MIENYDTKKMHDPDIRYQLPGEYDDTPEAPLSDLDGEKAEAKLKKLQDWVYQERVRQSENRKEQAIDANYADGLQWTQEEQQEMEERGQIPLVFNEIKPAVEWILGTEQRTKVDWDVLPRREEGIDDAKTKTKILKYLNDVNQTSFKRSFAFRHCVTVGVGWMETHISTDPEDEPIRHGNEHWRNVWWDSLSTQADLSDARYLFRQRYIDLDIAVEMWPDREEKLRSYAENRTDAPNYDEDSWIQSQVYYDSSSSLSTRVDDALAASHNRRMVVPVIEMWYREPKKAHKVRGTDKYAGRIYDAANDEMAALAKAGTISLHEAVFMEMRLAIFLDEGCLLHDSPSPYHHNRFPLHPIWCYRRDIDGMPYGIVRNARDAQFDLNKRRGKSLWLLSTVRTIMEENAVADLDEFIDEVGRPDAVIIKRAGKELEIQHNNALANEHIVLEDRDKNYIHSTSGVTAENLGHETNAVSGKAIQSRQTQGTVVTGPIFSNLRQAYKWQGQISLSLVEQFYNDEREFRITGEDGEHEFVGVNQFDPETGEYTNDVTARQADFVVSETDFRESVRQAMFEQMMNMLGQLPGELSIKMLDMVFELSDLPKKDEMVKRIRQLNGMPAPDETEEEAMQRQEAEAAEQEIMQRERMSAIEEREAAAAMKQAQVQQIMGQAVKLKSENVKTQLEAIKTGMETSGMMAQAPDIAEMLDDLMQELGPLIEGAEATQAQAAQMKQEAMQMQMQMQQESAMQQQQANMPPQQLPDDEVPPNGDGYQY